MAQLGKNLPAMRETWVQSLSWEDPLEKGKATHPSILAWRIPWTVTKGQTRLSDFHFTSLHFMLGLGCNVWAFSSCGRQGLLSNCGVQASHCSGFSHGGAQALECKQASVVVVHGLSCPMACGIFPHQGLNPWLLHW